MGYSFDAQPYQLVFHLLLSLGLGALIGIERERHRGEQQVLAGVRTYPLVSLSGAMAAHIGRLIAMPQLVALGAIFAGAFAILMYWVRQRLGTVGLTSPIALYATYFIGVFVGYDLTFEAIVAGVAITILLFTKERLHNLAKVLSPREMEGALYFIVIAFILYPVVPDEPVDPWNLFNLRNLLLIVILVSTFSFLSFLALRKWGTGRGFVYSGFLGGLVNSEAVSASLAHFVKRTPSIEPAARRGILLSTGTMFVRNLAICAIADPRLTLAGYVALPLLASSGVLLLWATVARGDGGGRETKVPLESPFALRPAFKFAAWFGLITVATLALRRVPGLGEGGIVLTAFGGLVSAAAVSASMASFVALGETDVVVAGATTVLASLLSASNKWVIARASSARLAAHLLPALWAAISVGALVLVLFHFL